MILVPVMSTTISPRVARPAERSATTPSTACATASEYCASLHGLLQRVGQAQRLVHDAHELEEQRVALLLEQVHALLRERDLLLCARAALLVSAVLLPWLALHGLGGLGGLLDGLGLLGLASR